MIRASEPAPRTSREGETYARWLASLAGLTVILLGIPVVLIAFHVAPPILQLGHMFARPGLVVHRFDDPLTDAAVAESMALAAWVVWLWLVACFAVELAAAIRGRPAMRLPASRHIQALVTTLVGASMAVFPAGRRGCPCDCFRRQRQCTEPSGARKDLRAHVVPRRRGFRSPRRLRSP